MAVGEVTRNPSSLAGPRSLRGPVIFLCGHPLQEHGQAATVGCPPVRKCGFNPGRGAATAWRSGRLVQRVEMQPGAAASIRRSHRPVMKSSPNALIERCRRNNSPACAPASANIGAAHGRETGQLAVVGDGHDARHDRQGDPQFRAIVDEVEIGVGVEEILGDGGIAPASTCV